MQYLTKKYLKKQNLRDYLRVIAHGKTGYRVCSGISCFTFSCPTSALRRMRNKLDFSDDYCVFVNKLATTILLSDHLTEAWKLQVFPLLLQSLLPAAVLHSLQVPLSLDSVAEGSGAAEEWTLSLPAPQNSDRPRPSLLLIATDRSATHSAQADTPTRVSEGICRFAHAKMFVN